MTMCLCVELSSFCRAVKLSSVGCGVVSNPCSSYRTQRLLTTTLWPSCAPSQCQQQWKDQGAGAALARGPLALAATSGTSIS